MTKTIVFAGWLLAAAGCDREDDARAPSADRDGVGVRIDSARPAVEDVRNGRDAVDGLTATDQSESEGDRNITREIRQRVMDQDELSMDAKNVKIITRSGVVTLRGLVEKAAERERIAHLAQSAKGVTHVDNQLEVENP